MSSTKGDAQIVMKSLPNIILKKNTITVLKSKTFKSVKPLYKEDIIYQSRFGDFLHLDQEKVTVFNRLNLNTMKSMTVARYTRSGEVVSEKTSEHIASIIGQDNYEIVISSLCSVISQEFKIRAILALLTVPKNAAGQRQSDSSQTKITIDVETQTVNSCMDSIKNLSATSQSCQSDLSRVKIMIDTETQTMMSGIDPIKKTPRRMKRQAAPYVVTDMDPPDKISRVVIHPENFHMLPKEEIVSVKSEKLDTSSDSSQLFLKSEHSEQLFNEDSRDSIGNLSVDTIPGLMEEPLALVDRVTGPVEKFYSRLTMLDGTELVIPCKIEDDFHVATPEILKLVSSPEDRRKLLWYQAYMDWKYCLTPDDDDNLPIHLAVLNDDVHLLKRQCLVLKTRKESVDVTNGDNMTALQLSILAKSPACTALLAQLNANPLVTDEEYRSCFHLAAEAGGEYLEPLVRMCREDPLTILRNNEELWKPEVAAKTKDFQVKHLLHKVCTMFDSQGYTPLMLASKLGKHDSVQALVSAAPASIDYRSTSSGETAFYLAVSAACTDSAQRGNKSKVFDDFKQTIIHLVEAGADPNIDNYSGNDISTLLADFSNSDLSMIIARKRTAINCKEFDDKLKEPAMLVKERDGTIMNLKEKLKKTKEINRIKGELKKESKGKGRRAKPVIIENKVISKPKASNEYINTYKNFVHDLKNPMLVPKTNQRKLIKYDYSNSKPSTSKTAPLTTAKSIVISPSKSKEPNLSLKVEKEAAKDPLNIDTNIKKEVDAIKSEESQNNSTAKADKRKIIIQSDIPIGPITKVVKSSRTLNR